MELKILTSPGETRIQVSGRIDDESDFTQLLKQLNDGGRFILDLSAISRINSSGVREWVYFVQAIKPNAHVDLVNCPVPFIEQVNMLNNFIGPTTIKSLSVPYACPGCEATIETIHSAETLATADPEAPRCKKCGSAMEYDIVPDLYLAFLRRR